MNGSISFSGDGLPVGKSSEETVAIMEAAMRRWFPHVVGWDVSQKDAPAIVHLPAGMSCADLLALARQEQVTFSAPANEHNVVKLHFAHLDPMEAEEGIARLGRAMVSYIHTCDRALGPAPLLFVGP